jgi:hypothetical protein
LRLDSLVSETVVVYISYYTLGLPQATRIVPIQNDTAQDLSREIHREAQLLRQWSETSASGEGVASGQNLLPSGWYVFVVPILVQPNLRDSNG